MSNINLTLTTEQFIRLIKETPTDYWLFDVLDKKVEAMQRREAFTTYRQAKTDEEKKTARIEYLKHRK